MIELLEAAARRDPASTAVITDDGTATYAEVLDRARACATGLREAGTSRFGIVHQDAAIVIALLAGASLAGAEACVYPPLDSEDLAAETAARFDHDVVVSDEPDLSGEFEQVSPAGLEKADGKRPTEIPDSRPLLILTTGTTGEPKGVRHDWSRLLRRAGQSAPAPDQRWLLAYGPHQFAGIQILIHVAALGATLVAPFPRRPPQGLAAMREHDVDHASATPTFWRFLLAEMRSGGPAPALRQITLGGEAVPEPLLGDLAEAFPEARISQVYAGNEFGQTGSVRDRHSGLPLSVLERGEEAHVAFKIVDGELWVRSRVGMLGYYGDPPVNPDEWRPTGDLVEIEGDRIVFQGRSTEIISVGGVKVHPLPVEERVSGIPGVALSRVYGRPNPLTGAIVAVDVVAEEGADKEEVDAAIREACSDLPSASQPRRIRFVDEIETKGEKVLRRVPGDG